MSQRFSFDDALHRYYRTRGTLPWSGAMRREHSAPGRLGGLRSPRSATTSRAVTLQQVETEALQPGANNSEPVRTMGFPLGVAMTTGSCAEGSPSISRHRYQLWNRLLSKGLHCRPVMELHSFLSRSGLTKVLFVGLYVKPDVVTHRDEFVDGPQLHIALNRAYVALGQFEDFPEDDQFQALLQSFFDLAMRWVQPQEGLSWAEDGPWPASTTRGGTVWLNLRPHPASHMSQGFGFDDSFVGALRLVQSAVDLHLRLIYRLEEAALESHEDLYLSWA